MEFFKQKSSELPVWAFALLMIAAAFIGFTLYNAVTTENIITSADNGSFEKRSWFGPMNAEDKLKVGSAFDERVKKAAEAKK